MRTAACVLALLGAFAALKVHALGGTPMVLGRMVAAKPDAPSVATTTHPRASFVLHCAGCHGRDGAGSPEHYVPDLRQLGAWLRVPGGREFVISVPGVMGSGLNDAEVAAVTNWLLENLAKPSVPANFRPYATEEVARARAKPLPDVAAERARLVQQARALGVALN